MGDQARQNRYHVEQILAQFKHITLQKNLIEIDGLYYCAVLDDVLHIELQLPFVWSLAFEQLKNETSTALKLATHSQQVSWSIKYLIPDAGYTQGKSPVQGVKNIIAISSGKGGVGKSSTAVNLALALSQAGAKVGILDADIYGPSIPTMLGVADQRPTSPDGNRMTPIYAHGLVSNSIGYLVDNNSAMVWRGPMASKTLMQLLEDTLWGELDYLVLDMPPGTGDIQLTLAQLIPVAGAVVVTTPQDVALRDAMKGVIMFNKVNVPIIGIIENMSYYICRHCGHRESLFGEDGGEKLADAHELTVLGKLPLHIHLREDLDSGTPTVVSRPDSELSTTYRQIAERVSSQIYWSKDNKATIIPTKTL